MVKNNCSSNQASELKTNALPSIAKAIALAVEEVEACTQYGIVEPHSDYWNQASAYSYAAIKNALSEAQLNHVVFECPKRDEWMTSALARFLDYLSDPVVTWELEAKGNDYFVKTQNNLLPIDLRAIGRQRYWGVAFYSRKSSRDYELARLYFQIAASKLASDITSINSLCERWARESSFLRSVSFTHNRLGNKFEYLILCVLNHVQNFVAQTSLLKDVFSWSDLRVIRSGTLNGIDIQVKFVHCFNAMEIADKNFKAKRSVILSPASLAEFVEHSFDPVLFECSWSEFLGIFRKPAHSAEDLGFQIYHWFAELIDSPRVNPMSPVSEIPFQILLAIHLFVAHSAATIKSRSSWRQAAIEAAKSLRASSLNAKTK